MKNDEPLSHIIFYGHKVWSVPANNVKLVARLTKAAIATHENADKGKNITTKNQIMSNRSANQS